MAAVTAVRGDALMKLAIRQLDGDSEQSVDVSAVPCILGRPAAAQGASPRAGGPSKVELPGAGKTVSRKHVRIEWHGSDGRYTGALEGRSMVRVDGKDITPQEEVGAAQTFPLYHGSDIQIGNVLVYVRLPSAHVAAYPECTLPLEVVQRRGRPRDDEAAVKEEGTTAPSSSSSSSSATSKSASGSSMKVNGSDFKWKELAMIARASMPEGWWTKRDIAEHLAALFPEGTFAASQKKLINSLGTQWAEEIPSECIQPLGSLDTEAREAASKRGNRVQSAMVYWSSPADVFQALPDAHQHWLRERFASTEREPLWEAPAAAAPAKRIQTRSSNRHDHSEGSSSKRAKPADKS